MRLPAYLKQKMSANKTNFYLDIILLLGFIIIMEPELSGINFHEWLSLAFGTVIIFHIILHWKWIIALTVRFFKTIFNRSRFKYVLSIILLISFVFVFLSGLMESQRLLPFFGLRASRNPIWEWLHSLTSDLMWFAVGLHLVLDWRWIVNAIRRYVFHPLHLSD